MENSLNESDTEDSLNIATKNWDRIISTAKKVQFLYQYIIIKKTIPTFSMNCTTILNILLFFKEWLQGRSRRWVKFCFSKWF